MLNAGGRDGRALCVNTAPGRSLHTGMCDAARCAVACTTTPGDGMQSRITGEILRALGLNELIEEKDQQNKKAKIWNIFETSIYSALSGFFYKARFVLERIII